MAQNLVFFSCCDRQRRLEKSDFSIYFTYLSHFNLPHLDICLGENPWYRDEGVEFCPENTPARQRVSVIDQIKLKWKIHKLNYISCISSFESIVLYIVFIFLRKSRNFGLLKKKTSLEI